MTRRFMMPLAICAAGLTGLTLQAQTESPPEGLFAYDDPVRVAAGAVVYEENCASCHGVNLEGQPDWRSLNADGRLPAPPHDMTGHTWHHPDIQLFQIVKYGTAALVGNGYESDMAGYDGVLTDSEILDVMAYIKSTWPDRIIEQHNAMNAAVASQ